MKEEKRKAQKMAVKEKKKEKKRTLFAQGEWPVYYLLTLLLLLAFGIITLFSASHVSAYIESGDSYQYVKAQGGYMLLGIGVIFFVGCFDYHLLRRFSLASYVISLFLLMVVAFTCDPLNGAKRWLYWENGPNIIVLQVSEIVKFVMIIVTAQIVCYYYAKNRKNWRGLFYPLLASLPLVGFVFCQPHLSGTIIILGIVTVMVVMSGVGTMYLVVMAVLAVPLGAIAFKIALSISYVSDRLAGWTLDVADMEWQTMQSVYAIGSGGFAGLGFGRGVQKQLWLPEATNDFIFSVICEELGFIGAVIVIFLFMAFIAQGFIIAMQAADLYGSLIAIGITSQIALQFAFNIGVVTGLLPNTGISLPFFSSGGTSLLMLLGECGFMVSIARAGNDAKARRAERALEEELARKTQPQEVAPPQQSVRTPRAKQ